MKFREDPRTRHIDWESLSWVKSFRGNVPPFKKTEAVLEDVEPRDGGLRILAKVAGLDLTVIIPPTDPAYGPDFAAWLRKHRGRLLRDLYEEELDLP